MIWSGKKFFPYAGSLNKYIIVIGVLKKGLIIVIFVVSRLVGNFCVGMKMRFTVILAGKRESYLLFLIVGI